MLTRFFGKSNPINYVLLSVLLFVGLLLAIFKGAIPFSSASEIAIALTLLLLLIFGLLLLDFVIRKNNLTGKNTFGMLVFTLFIVQLPVIYGNSEIIGATLFLMMATRRLLSLKSGKNIEKKILDASFYITIAGFFYPWCWLFFGILILGIFWHTSREFRYFIIPVIGALVVFMLKTAYHYMVDDSFAWFLESRFNTSFDFSAYHNASLLITSSLIVTFILWMGAVRFIRIPALPKKERSSAWLILMALGATLCIAILGEIKTGAELLIPLFPLAIITANYLEKNEDAPRTQPFDFWFKEILMLALLIVSIALFFV